MTVARIATPILKILLAAFGILAPLFLSQQVPTTITHNVGELEKVGNIDGLYEPEIGTHGSFRWTKDLVAVQLQPLGYPLHVTVRVQGVRPTGSEPAQMRASSTGRDLGIQVLPQEPITLTYRLPVITVAQINPNITLNPTTFQPPGDARRLGIVLYRVEERNAPGPWPAVPALWTTIPLLLGGLLVSGLCITVFRRWTWAVLGACCWGGVIGLLNAFARPWLVFYSWYFIVPPLVLLASLFALRDIRNHRRINFPDSERTIAAYSYNSIGGARSIAGFLVTTALLLLVWHLLAPGEPQVRDNAHNVSWGVSYFNRLPTPYQTAGILLVVGAIAWAWLAPFKRGHNRTTIVDPDCWPRMTWRLLPMVVVLMGMILFTVFPTAYSEGDSWLWNRLSPQRIIYEPEPLDFYIKVKLYRAFNPPLNFFTDAFQVVAVLAGGLYIAGAYAVSATLGRDRKETLIMLAALLSIGNMLFFFRYIETYALVTAVGLWLIWACWRYIDGKLSFTPVVAIFTIAVLLHGVALWLAPMVGTALLLHSRSLPPQERKRHMLREFSYGWVIAIALFAIFASFIILDGYNLAIFQAKATGLGGDDSRMFVPLSISGDSTYEHYTLFSWSHIGALAQEQLLTGPLALLTVVAVCAIAWKDVRNMVRATPGLVAVAIGAASSLLFAVVWNPDLGPRSDWDLLALPAPLLTTLAVYPLLHLPDGKPKHLAIAAYLSLSFVHTLGWLLLHILWIGY
jgi:hypothetical protein